MALTISRFKSTPFSLQGKVHHGLASDYLPLVLRTLVIPNCLLVDTHAFQFPLP